MDEKVYYEQVRDEAKAFYKNLKEIPCAVLDNEYIEFGNAGFQHLLKKGGFPRPKKDQIRRFILLRQVEHVLRNPNAFIILRSKSSVTFWKICAPVGNKMVKVVIRQFPKTRKHFFSIMENKI